VRSPSAAAQASVLRLVSPPRACHASFHHLARLLGVNDDEDAGLKPECHAESAFPFLDVSRNMT